MDVFKGELLPLLFGDRLPRSIAVIGSGGKTSTIANLADEYMSRGMRVIITPTTKMAPPRDRSLLAHDAPEALRIARERGLAFLGDVLGEHKMSGLAAEKRHLLFEDGVAVLSEADGSRTLPMKATAYYEPVVPDDADGVILLFGLESVGRPLNEVCHRFELAAEILGCAEDAAVTPEMAARLLRASYFDKLPNREIVVMLNKCDDAARESSAREIAALLGGAKCVPMRLR